ncbi:MAG: hypothetical protein H0W81_00055 [Chloroflexi bacterium]|nr:hypothetical protein [Chloroflexota bacterium]
MSPLARRVAALSVLLLSLTIIAFVGVRAAGVGILASPTPVATTATPGPSGPPPSPNMMSVLGQIEKQVQELRGLPAADIGPPQIMTRNELAQVLPGLLEPALDNATLRALGLLDADQDIVALTEQLYVAQVAGYYDFDAKRMVVVTDAGLTPAAQITYAHEYTHALQDAAFDSSAAQEAVAGQRDWELALLALKEGDASTSMVVWAIGHLSADEVAGVVQAPLPDMTGIPPWMVRLLEFPYLSGAEFVGRLYASGGWKAVDAAYAKLPASTEQVLHSAAYANGEAPVEVDPLDLWSAVGANWAHASDTTLGESWMAIWLEGIGVTRSAADKAAEGWGGDRMTVATNADGSWALGWRIAWDTSADASEFETVYSGVQPDLSFAARLVHVSDRETVVLQASSPDLLETIAPITGG